MNLESCASIESKIDKIDLIIDSLFTVAMTSVLNGDTMQYTLDTGQTKVMKTFNSPKMVTDAIKEYESIRQMYVNKITPRNIRLVDSKNFRHGR
jgi:hypothetical protein